MFCRCTARELAKYCKKGIWLEEVEAYLFSVCFVEISIEEAQTKYTESLFHILVGIMGNESENIEL